MMAVRQLERVSWVEKVTGSTPVSSTDDKLAPQGRAFLMGFKVLQDSNFTEKELKCKK